MKIAITDDRDSPQMNYPEGKIESVVAIILSKGNGFLS